MAFIDYSRELSGTIPNLSDVLARNLVNQAYQQLRDERRWSWLVAESFFFVPSVITGGTVSVTQFSPQVQCDATSGPLIAAAALQLPPLVGRQFRVSSGGAIYNIVGFDNVAFILTLDRPYLEQSSQATTTYFVYQCYYPAPSQDFLKFISVLNPVEGYSMNEHQMNCSKQEFDKRDPQRGAQGDPYWIGFYRNDPTSMLNVYELWPHPVNSYGLPFMYQRRGEDFVNDSDSLPPSMPPYPFMELVRYQGCMWAATNAGRYPELAKVPWLQTATMHMQVYQKWLQKAKIADDDIFLRNWTQFHRTSGFYGPLDAKFLQAHDATWF